MSPIPVIIDVDTGTDDAIAIICALQMPKLLEIRAITTVAGNAGIEKTSKNTLNLVNYLGHNTPVSIGANKPLVREHVPATSHGATGLGDVTLPTNDAEFSLHASWHLIYKEAVACQGELRILAVAPLTNIALAIKYYPNLRYLIKSITIMGGALVGGNMTQVSEFNIYSDPESAKIVFDSGIPIKMVGLDVTLIPRLPLYVYEKISRLNNKYSSVSKDIFDYMNKVEREYSNKETNLHDVIALCALTTEHVLKYEKYYIDIECKGELTRGMTVADFRKVCPEKEINALAANGIDVDAFWLWFTSIYTGEFK